MSPGYTRRFSPYKLDKWLSEGQGCLWTLEKSNLKNLRSLEDLFLNNLAPSVDIMVGLALRIFRSSVDTLRDLAL